MLCIEIIELVYGSREESLTPSYAFMKSLVLKKFVF